MIDIAGLDKAEVLAALYNRARPLGLGHLQYEPSDMTKEQAAKLLESSTYFDYVKGRVMKINLKSDDQFSPSLYDRDNGTGAAESVIKELRKRVSS